MTLGERLAPFVLLGDLLARSPLVGSSCELFSDSKRFFLLESFPAPLCSLCLVVGCIRNVDKTEEIRATLGTLLRPWAVLGDAYLTEEEGAVFSGEIGRQGNAALLLEHHCRQGHVRALDTPEIPAGREKETHVGEAMVVWARVSREGSVYLARSVKGPIAVEVRFVPPLLRLLSQLLQ